MDLNLPLLPFVEKLLRYQLNCAWLHLLDKFHLVEVEWVKHTFDAEYLLVKAANVDKSFLWMLLTHHAVIG